MPDDVGYGRDLITKALLMQGGGVGMMNVPNPDGPGIDPLLPDAPRGDRTDRPPVDTNLNPIDPFDVRYGAPPDDVPMPQPRPDVPPDVSGGSPSTAPYAPISRSRYGTTQSPVAPPPPPPSLIDTFNPFTASSAGRAMNAAYTGGVGGPLGFGPSIGPMAPLDYSYGGGFGSQNAPDRPSAAERRAYTLARMAAE